MPPPRLFDTAAIDLSDLIVTRDEIYTELPHRFEFMQLDGIVHLDLEKGEAIAVRHVREDEFWVRGHVPGRPLFPGVLMMESAAQVASFVSARTINMGGRLLGFGGVDKFKFRDTVTPPASMIILARLLQAKPRRVICSTQGYVGDKMVFEGEITGIRL